MPQISIIVPNFNHASFLQQRLDSIFNQTYQNFEVILLDDCSTDSSLHLLKTYVNHDKVSYCIKSNYNTGSPFKQWKKGIELASGKYIWIAESDDYCEPQLLEKIVLLLEENNQLGIAYCQTHDVDDKGKLLNHRIHYTNNFIPNIWEDYFAMDGFLFVKKYMNIKNVIPNASAVVFKKELVDMSIFNNSLLEMKMCGDWLFWIKLLLNSRIAFLPDTLNYFRSHKATTRVHDTILIKKQRLLEESVVYEFLYKYNIKNFSSEFHLYQRWFAFWSVKSIFSNSFYKIKLKKTSKIVYLFCFIYYKVQKWFK
ncbi:MAG: glycosyltransferase family 2 protein [Bacteroidetes bacterium]|nr:glycosyltransferase family 2 protein [Bacteroidota bacterium]